MTLLRKFAVLLAVLGLMVVLNLATSLWAVSILRREVSVYLHSISVVLGGLNGVKRDLSGIAAAIPAPPSPSTPPSVPWTAPPPGPGVDLDRHFRESRERIAARLATLRDSGTFSARSGISARLNLEQRIGAALADSARWFESMEAGSPDPAAALAAREQLFTLHELIERTEAKILGDARQAVLHGRDIRAGILAVVLATLAISLAAGILGLALVRRWVVRPVAQLRAAAGRIAAGDLAHRIPVRGGDELALLSAEVNHMAAMVSAMQDERVERERLAAVGEMVRRIAHNLRNPLAGIRSLAELTKADLPPDEPSQESQDRIIASVDRFERWLSELLTASTPPTPIPAPSNAPDAAPHPLAIRPVLTPVAPWLAGLVEPLRPMAAARGVEIRLDLAAAPAEAEFDAGHLEQALVGVITNAVQASRPGQAVTVSARGEPGPGGGIEEGFWEIRVRDRGPGVPPELAERIFAPYFTTKADGTGIGLAVARRVAEQHGGRISIAGPDEPDERLPPPETGPGGGAGAVFVFRLPVRVWPGLATGASTGAHVGQDSDRRG